MVDQRVLDLSISDLAGWVPGESKSWGSLGEQGRTMEREKIPRPGSISFRPPPVADIYRLVEYGGSTEAMRNIRRNCFS